MSPEDRRSEKASARLKPCRGPPMTLGVATTAEVRLIIWRKECQHQVEPDPAGMAAQYGPDTPVLDWRERLVHSGCGGRPARGPSGDSADVECGTILLRRSRAQPVDLRLTEFCGRVTVSRSSWGL